MSNSQIEIINAQTEDNLTGLIIDGVPHLYWLRVYKALKLTKAHAVEVIKRLTEGTHYRKFTKEEFLLLSGTVNVSGTVDNRARAYYFLTKEGVNRAFTEIDTSHMSDPEAVDKVNEIRDQMANIFTRYQAGETLSLATDQIPALPGEIDEFSSSEKRIKLYNTARKVAISLGANRQAINRVMVEKIKDECPEVYPFMAMVPEGESCDMPDDAVLTRKEVSGILKVKLQDLEDRIVRIGWATRAPYGWGLTKKGMMYLKQDPHIGEKKAWYDIRFGLDAIRLLKQEFEQRVLTGGYMSSGCCRGAVPVTGVE